MLLQLLLQVLPVLAVAVQAVVLAEAVAVQAVVAWVVVREAALAPVNCGNTKHNQSTNSGNGRHYPSDTQLTVPVASFGLCSEIYPEIGRVVRT